MNISNKKDKFVGEVKTKVGKITGDKKMEIKGKVQSTKADIAIKVDDVKKKIDKADVGKKLDNVKEDMKDAQKEIAKKAKEIKDKIK